MARLSVSQLQRFLDCERKWHYKYIGGVDEPEREWFKVGKEGHKRFEDYYKIPDQPVLTPEDQKVLPLLPTYGTPVEAESEIKHLELAGIPFQGSIDLVHGDDIYDYKFQSRIQKFAEPSPQAWGYLEELRRRQVEVSGSTGERPEDIHLASLRFHYILISKKGAEPVKQTFEFSPEVIKKAWEEYAPTVERMKLVAEGKEKPRANDQHCYKYGPCPYLGICDRGTMSFLDDIKAAKKEGAAVELPDVDADEPTEEAKAAALEEAKSFRPPEVKRGIKYNDSKYDHPKLQIRTVEVRHSVTLDIKRDGIFSASIGVGFTADVEVGKEDEIRKALSEKILDAIKHEAERYKKS